MEKTLKGSFLGHSIFLGFLLYFILYFMHFKHVIHHVFSREHIHDFILFGHTLPFYLVGKKCRLSLNFFPRLHFSRAKYSCCFVIVAICALLLWKIIFNVSEHIFNDLDLS